LPDPLSQEQGGQRWFHLYPHEEIKHDDVLHWTKLNQNWNFMRAECHSTGVHKNYDAANDRFATSFSSWSSQWASDSSSRMAAGWLSARGAASGRLNVVTPFHHLSGNSHLHRSLGAGPITASSTSHSEVGPRQLCPSDTKRRGRCGFPICCSAPANSLALPLPARIRRVLAQSDHSEAKVSEVQKG
jgi:hypothetical protein